MWQEHSSHVELGQLPSCWQRPMTLECVLGSGYMPALILVDLRDVPKMWFFGYMYLYQFPRFGIQALFFLPRCIGISRCHDVLYLMVLKSFRKRSLTLLPSGFCRWNRTGYKAAASIKAAIVPLRFWHAGPSPTQVRPTFERSLVLCLSFSFSFALFQFVVVVLTVCFVPWGSLCLWGNLRVTIVGFPLATGRCACY